MRLTIFSKLVAGYLAIFILVIIVSIYATVQFQKLEDATDSILNIDNRMLSYNKKLIDALLSQVQHERKFLIIKDDTLYERESQRHPQEHSFRTRPYAWRRDPMHKAHQRLSG